MKLMPYLGIKQTGTKGQIVMIVIACYVGRACTYSILTQI
jgi:hypothetical protein